MTGLKLKLKKKWLRLKQTLNADFIMYVTDGVYVIKVKTTPQKALMIYRQSREPYIEPPKHPFTVIEGGKQ